MVIHFQVSAYGRSIPGLLAQWKSLYLYVGNDWWTFAILIPDYQLRGHTMEEHYEQSIVAVRRVMQNGKSLIAGRYRLMGPDGLVVREDVVGTPLRTSLT